MQNCSKILQTLVVYIGPIYPPNQSTFQKEYSVRIIKKSVYVAVDDEKN